MKFDIILPSIGRTSLEVAIDSVIAQTHQEWRLFIMCEGWKWNVRPSLFAEERIFVIANPDMPHNDSGTWARNHAIRISEAEDASEWIAYLDDDDVWLSNHLTTISNLLIEHQQATMVKTVGQSFSWRHRSPRHKKKVRKLGAVNNADVLTPGMVHTRELFKQTSGWQVGTAHDKDLWNEMLKMGGVPVISDTITFQFER